MTALTPFEYDGQQVRVVSIDGEPWFIPSDICVVLGHSNASQAIAQHVHPDDSIRTTLTIREGSRDVTRERTIVNESGLYALIFGSSLPQAVEFKRWITGEVLPSIRQRGGYLTHEAAEQALTDPDFIIRLATELKTERARRAELEVQVAEDAPKVEFADAVAAADGTILVGELAKVLRGNGIEIGSVRLFEWLRQNGYLMSRRGSSWNAPTQRSMELGLFRVKETTVTHSDGSVSVSITPTVTGKGQAYFVRKFLAAKEVMSWTG